MNEAPAPPHEHLVPRLDLDRQPRREVRDQRFAFALAQLGRFARRRGVERVLRDDQLAARIAALLQHVREHEIRRHRIRRHRDLREQLRVVHSRGRTQ